MLPKPHDLEIMARIAPLSAGSRPPTAAFPYPMDYSQTLPSQHDATARSQGRTSEKVQVKFVEFALSTSRAKTVPGLFYLAFVAVLVIPGQG
jgi:hypothetical protein